MGRSQCTLLLFHNQCWTFLSYISGIDPHSPRLMHQICRLHVLHHHICSRRCSCQYPINEMQNPSSETLSFSIRLCIVLSNRSCAKCTMRIEQSPRHMFVTPVFRWKFPILSRQSGKVFWHPLVENV